MEKLLLRKESQLLEMKESLIRIIELNDELINKEKEKGVKDIESNALKDSEIQEHKLIIKEINDQLESLDQEAEDYLSDKKSLDAFIRLNEYVIQVLRKSIETNQ